MSSNQRIRAAASTLGEAFLSKDRFAALAACLDVLGRDEVAAFPLGSLGSGPEKVWKPSLRADSGWALSPAEEARRLRNRAIVRTCGDRWISLWRMKLGEDCVREEKMATRVFCGLLSCRECSERARKRKLSRMLYPWDFFITLTFPQRNISREEAWRQVNGWITATLDWMVRWYRTWMEDTGQDTPFEYAWTVEPHQSGYPHVHVCLQAPTAFDELWEARWERAHGLGRSNVQVDLVYDPGMVAAYLAKYVSKSQLPEEILAIRYRQKSWWCTVNIMPRQSGGWSIQEGRPKWADARSRDPGRIQGEGNGFVVERKIKGVCIIMARQWPDGSKLQRSPEDAHEEWMIWNSFEVPERVELTSEGAGRKKQREEARRRWDKEYQNQLDRLAYARETAQYLVENKGKPWNDSDMAAMRDGVHWMEDDQYRKWAESEEGKQMVDELMKGMRESADISR